MVAIKKLRTQKCKPNINHLRKLNHENIVRFRGVCTGSQFHCLIMEYCQYGPLFDFLHSGVSFNPKQIVRWARDIALGMSYLHAHKIIHRDLKSPNVLITDNLVVKVIDIAEDRRGSIVIDICNIRHRTVKSDPEFRNECPSFSVNGTLGVDVPNNWIRSEQRVVWLKKRKREA